MGVKLTGTLVAANLLAVSGLAGLQLYSAVRTIEAENLQPPGASIDFRASSSDQPSGGTLATEPSFPRHPVRVVARSLDQGGPRAQLLAAMASAEPAQTLAAQAVPGPSTEDLPLIGETQAAADLEQAAEDLGRLTTAAGPGHAMRGLSTFAKQSPEEAWQAAPRRQMAYRAKIDDPDPAAAAMPATAGPNGGSAKAGEFLARILSPESAEGAGYVVIGSYGSQENAAIEAKAFGQWQPKIMTAKVKGKTYFRVAVGPFTRADLTPALKAVVADGAKNAWPLVP